MLLRTTSRISIILCASSLFGRSTGVSAFSHSRFGSLASRTMSLAPTNAHTLSDKMLVSIDEGIGAHASPDVKFIDGSWFMPSDRNAKQEFESGPRIAGAHFFDIDDIATPSNLPHMMPPKELFAAAMDAMGISNEDHIVVYGSENCMFYHRAWYQIRNMGHARGSISLLQGSIVDWKNAGGPTETEGTKPTNPIINSKDLDTSSPAKYQAKDPINVVSKNELKDIIEKGEDSNMIIVDVRSSERYLGQVEEPRPGLRLGHMPGAKNVFFKDLLDPENVSRMKSKEEMEKIIAAGGVDISSPSRIVSSCGSGATACTLVVALELCGKNADDVYVYDGSWSEWGGSDDTPIV